MRKSKSLEKNRTLGSNIDVFINNFRHGRSMSAKTRQSHLAIATPSSRLQPGRARYQQDDTPPSSCLPRLALSSSHSFPSPPTTQASRNTKPSLNFTSSKLPPTMAENCKNCTSKPLCIDCKKEEKFFSSGRCKACEKVIKDKNGKSHFPEDVDANGFNVSCYPGCGRWV